MRFGQDNEPFEQAILRSGLGYQYTPTMSFWLGYDHVASSVNDSFNDFDNENRVWQQVTWAFYHNKRVTLRSRSRFETRFMQGNSQQAYRMRQQFSLVSPQMILNRYTPVINDEVFFNVNRPDWVEDKTLDRNRLFIGISIPAAKDVAFTVGYLNQYAFREPDNEMDHIVYLSIDITTG